MLGVINRAIIYQTADIMLSLYKSLVRPHLDYCMVAWSPHCVKYKELLEHVQRRFTRLIPKLKELSYPERLDKLTLWSLEERRVHADLIEVYNVVCLLYRSRTYLNLKIAEEKMPARPQIVLFLRESGEPVE